MINFFLTPPSWLPATARYPGHWLVIEILGILLIVAGVGLFWKGGEPHG